MIWTVEAVDLISDQLFVVKSSSGRYLTLKCNVESYQEKHSTTVKNRG